MAKTLYPDEVCWVNSHGAVAGYCDNGDKLGVKPGEFDVVEWHDAGPDKCEGQVPVYHTHGLRQYMGTCKMHKRSDCRYLVNWRPGRGLGKTIMREWENRYEDVPKIWRCKTCFAS